MKASVQLNKMDLGPQILLDLLTFDKYLLYKYLTFDRMLTFAHAANLITKIDQIKIVGTSSIIAMEMKCRN